MKSADPLNVSRGSSCYSFCMASRTESSDDKPQESAVDLSLIDAMLALSPEERLRHNDRMLRTIELLRQGIAEKTEVHGG